MKKKVAIKNSSPVGWWCASYIERFEFDDEDLTNPNRRCLAHENTVLIKARDRQQAYRKAMRIGQVSEGSEGWDRETGRKGCWRFDGLTSLVAVYEEIEDGAEIIWREYQGKAVRSIQARVRTKQQLEAFDDSGEES